MIMIPVQTSPIGPSGAKEGLECSANPSESWRVEISSLHIRLLWWEEGMVHVEGGYTYQMWFLKIELEILYVS